MTGCPRCRRAAAASSPVESRSPSAPGCFRCWVCGPVMSSRTFFRVRASCRPLGGRRRPAPASLLQGDVVIPAAIYVRVSKDDGSQTTDNQLPDVRQMATGRGYVVAPEHLYTDEASGAKGTDERPALAAMLQAAARGRFKAVFVWRLDRLSRDDTFRGGLQMIGRARSLRGGAAVVRRNLDRHGGPLPVGAGANLADAGVRGAPGAHQADQGRDRARPPQGHQVGEGESAGRESRRRPCCSSARPSFTRKRSRGGSRRARWRPKASRGCPASPPWPASVRTVQKGRGPWGGCRARGGRR